ncbi:MAG: SAM-dependent methyltransferase, partial [Myxococcales bacterium]
PRLVAAVDDEDVADDAEHPIETLVTALEAALKARGADLPGPDAQAAMRLFSGFYEGYPSLTIDLYGSTVVFHDHSSRGNERTVRAALEVVKKRLPWIRAGLWKLRKASDPNARGGRIVFGSEAILADRVREDGVWYALDLTHHQDATLYLDTRPLRSWLKANMAGKSVLNTFAYTGSLGVAALAGGATRALQLDRNPAYLDIARRSSQLNGLVVKRRDLVAADFFEHIGRLKKDKLLFDAIIVDPPFFSRNDRTKVDQEAESLRLLNKVRPLIADGGVLIAVNNALYLPGTTFMGQLESLTTDSYLTIESQLPVPADLTGYPETRVGTPPVDPAPFNHATKIAILRVRRKDRKKATPAP